jgi:hypothetical protein
MDDWSVSDRPIANHCFLLLLHWSVYLLLNFEKSVYMIPPMNATSTAHGARCSVFFSRRVFFIFVSGERQLCASTAGKELLRKFYSDRHPDA